MTTVEIPAAFGFLWDETADDGGPVRHRACHGGRGGAKSHSYAKALLLKGAERKLRVGCYREIQVSIKESVKRLLDDQIELLGLSSFYQSTDTEIRGRNGTLFTFAGLRTNPESIKSTEGIDIAWVAEANKVAQRSIDLLIPTIRKPGSECWWEWNPEFDTDPVDRMFRGGTPPPGSIVRQVNYDQNPFFPDVLRQELEWDRARDPDKYAHIWLGEYQRNSEARVFRNWRVEEFDAPGNAEFRFGADWGFSIDPTVLVRCHLDGRTLYVDHEAYAIGCEIDRTPALFDKVPGSRRWRITADSARPETVSYMQRQGFKIVSAIKGQGSLEDGIEFLRSFDIVVHPRCRHTIDELTLYSYKTDRLTGEILPVLDDKDNHVIDALRYALEALRRKGPTWDEQPGKRNPRDPPDLWSRERGGGDSWKVA